MTTCLQSCPLFYPVFSVHLRVPTQLSDFLIDSTVLNRTHETETPSRGACNYLRTDIFFSPGTLLIFHDNAQFYTYASWSNFRFANQSPEFESCSIHRP